MNEGILENLLKQSIALSELINSSLTILKTSRQTLLDPHIALKVFFSSLNYHRDHVKITKEIIELLKDTKENSLDKEYVELLSATPPVIIEKVKKSIRKLSSIDFIPRELSVCPKCGSYFSDNSCQKYKVFLDKECIGYSYNCKEVNNGIDRTD